MILLWIEGADICNTERRGKTSKPFAMSERLMISRCSEEPPEMLRFGCLGCGREDRLLVGLQDGEPGREILRVIRSRRVSDAEIGAEEGGSAFGDLS